MKRLFVVLLVAAVGLAGSASTSFACINAVKERTDSITKLLAEGASALEKGHYRESIRTLFGRFNFLPKKKASEVAELSAVEREALEILAVSVLRTAGAYEIDPEASSISSKKARARNLKWAESMIEALAKDASESASVKFEAYTAEILARRPDKRREAYEKLKEIAKKDLMPDAYGYRLLEGLASMLDDEPTAKMAKKKCEKASPKGSVVCKIRPRM